MKAPWTLIETVPGERMAWSIVDRWGSFEASAGAIAALTTRRLHMSAEGVYVEDV